MQESIRILLVDTPTIFRRSLAALLGRRRRLQVLGEAATGAEALVRARLFRPDVAVVEPTVPGGGLQLVAQLCQEIPACAVLLLTDGRSHSAAARALQVGARGWLKKDCTLDDLVQAIERVHAGELVVVPAVAEAVIRDLSSGHFTELSAPSLTARELEVLRLVAQGRTNPEIARQLCITEHTAKGHLAKILGKLGLENRVQIAAYAMRHGLVAPPRPKLLRGPGHLSRVDAV